MFNLVMMYADTGRLKPAFRPDNKFDLRKYNYTVKFEIRSYSKWVWIGF